MIVLESVDGREVVWVLLSIFDCITTCPILLNEELKEV